MKFREWSDVVQYEKDEKRKDKQTQVAITANYFSALALIISIVALYISWIK